MAGAAAAREGAVILGLHTLEAMGHLAIVELQEQRAVLAVGKASGQAAGVSLSAGLQEILEETSAYRRFFLQSDSSMLGLDSV